MPKSWYLAQIKPNGLERAVTNLARQGFTTFVPRQRSGTQSGQPSGRGRALPLFPGYVFVQFDPAEAPWRSIGNTFGVSRLVSLRKDRPDQVPDAVMQALLARCDAEGCLKPPEDLVQGDRVEITDGPFSGWVTEVSALPGPERVMVLLSVMGKDTPTSVPLEALRKL